MKRLVLTFEDAAFEKLKRAVFVRSIAAGMGGAIDALAAIVVECIEAGVEEKHLRAGKGGE